MFQSRLDDIAAFIMEHNKYFNTGFSNVWLDESTGFVADDKTAVFPADSLGEYFYLRLPKSVDFIYSKDYKYSECLGGIGSRTQVVLVAITQGNGDKLLENLVATLRNYGNSTLLLKSSIYQPAYVIDQELKFISETERAAARQRINPSLAYVSILFEVVETILSDKLNCIQPPCTC